MKQIFIILISAILVDNFVLSKFLGICPFLGVSKKLDSAVGMSIAVTCVMVVASAATWPIYRFILYPNYMYLETMVFILIIAALVQLIEITIKKYLPALYKSLGVYLPLITTNCAVLAITILNLDKGYSFFQSLINALGGGIGFLFAMVLFSGVRLRMESAVFSHNGASQVPKAYQGIPITLVAASIVALAFMGFTGVIDGIFG